MPLLHWQLGRRILTASKLEAILMVVGFCPLPLEVCMSTGSTLGKGIAQYHTQLGNESHCEDFEKLKKFINEETGYKFAFGSHNKDELRIKAVSRCNSHP